MSDLVTVGHAMVTFWSRSIRCKQQLKQETYKASFLLLDTKIYPGGAIFLNGQFCLLSYMTYNVLLDRQTWLITEWFQPCPVDLSWGYQPWPIIGWLWQTTFDRNEIKHNAILTTFDTFSTHSFSRTTRGILLRFLPLLEYTLANWLRVLV